MSELLKKYRAGIDKALDDALSGCEGKPYERLLEAMRYSALADGKRVRPTLVCAFCEACDGDYRDALTAAAAVEMIHAFSLIHDDLPAMDNDDMRRGRPTNHKVYGEACALLAGDALIFRAISLCAGSEEAVREICHYSGLDGMTGGQQIDIEGSERPLTLAQTETMYELKTCALMILSCRLGVIAAHGSEEELEAAKRFGKALGMAFQITDDLIELESGTGEDDGKSTYVSLVGMENAYRAADTYTEKAKEALLIFSDPFRGKLEELCNKLLRRKV